ncbi:ABC transporter substrate-binding protein [Tropicimonas marinistellae]|uniref:ABC transporter substrate-binding protein n=1 Tax=Tropicimonas marinistellae TaxID=1739787 RepID=UPI000830406C|nr:ABC transporter substrate-binding protein [Tropicimonas marinistellae]
MRLLTTSALCGLAIGATAQIAGATDEVDFQLDWTPGGISAAYYLGVEKGCFTDQDIDVTISRGYGAADAVTKVATGVADFSVTDLGVIIGSIAESGAPVKAIMPIVAQSPMAIAVMADSDIGELKDLEGHSIASSVGNAAMAFLPLGMEVVGGDMSKVEIITAEGSALTGLLLQKRVDALASYITSVKRIDAIAAKSGMEVRGIHYGSALDIYNASIFTSDAMIAENPDLVNRFKAAIECTYDEARADPAAAVDAIVAGVEGMQRDTQTDMVPFSFGFAFDNPVFEANGYAFDIDRVAHNIAIVDKVTPLSTELTPEDVVYVPAE